MASTLFHGGRVHVRSGVSAEALLSRDGRVVAVGRASDLARDAGKAERVDLRGGLMTPGWFDAHVHFMWWGFQMAELDLRATKTIDEALEQIGGRAREVRPGGWLTGGRFDKNNWGRWPTAADLDRVTGDRPTVMRSRDGHSRWLNTAALRAAEIGKDTVAPDGGAIFRDATGAPTGVLQERANELADRAVPAATEADCDAATMRAQDEALKRGVTGVESLEQASSYAALKRARDRGQLKVRALMGIPHRSLALSLPTTGTPPQIRDTAPFDFEAALRTGMRTGQGDEWLQLGHVKFFSDGALGSQTAALEDPYEGTDDRGILTFDPLELRTDVARAAAGGLAVAIHAIGDRAVRVALDAIAPTRITSPALRQRLEHIQLVREEDLGRFGALGIIASMQPIHCPSDRDLADRYWGPKRTPRAYPWRTLLERGAVLAFGSDAPVEPIDPLLGIHAAVTRRRPGDRDAWFPAQRLTLDEAIHGYTAGAAYSTGREREWGTLEVGMRCDATVVDRDLAKLDGNELLDARVTGTITDGVVRYADGLA
ncbi:MAG TPA: amidohydrolase [Methylomirabilota bacterium]|nr:amidohydrolase [Methylomirabilota bacterium]